MKSKLAFILTILSFNIYAVVDPDESNHYTKANELNEEICPDYSFIPKCSNKDTLKQTSCVETEKKVCKSKIRVLEIAGNLSINKDVAKVVDSYAYLDLYNQTKFNSNLVKKCVKEFNDRPGGLIYCLNSIAENNIAEELFDFCDFDLVCISRLSDLEKVPPHVGQSNFDHCKKNYKRFGVYACVRNSVKTKGITKLLKTIGSLEEKLYQCSNKLLGNTIESDIEMIKIFTNSSFEEAIETRSKQD